MPLWNQSIPDKKVLCCCLMFGSQWLAFATNDNCLSCLEISSGKQFSIQYKECFITSLEFYEKEGILIVGQSNNIISFINPRNYKFKVLKMFYDMSAFPVLYIKCFMGISKMILVNSVNEVILCERTNHKTVKFESQGIMRLKESILDIQILEFPNSDGVVIGLISTEKIKLVWVTISKKFTVKLIESIYSPFMNSDLNSISRKSSMEMEKFTIEKNKSSIFNFSNDNDNENKVKYVLTENQLKDKIIQHNKQKEEGIFLIDKKLWRSTGDKFLSISIYGHNMVISFWIILPDSQIMKTMTESHDFNHKIISAGFVGIETLFVLFENRTYALVNLDQFRLLSSQGIDPKISLENASIDNENEKEDQAENTNALERNLK